MDELERPDPDRLLRPAPGARSAARSGAGSRSSSGTSPAWARPTPCSRRPSARRPPASTSSSATSRPTARRETDALLEGLECCPPLDVEYRGIKLREFDLDAALARHPDDHPGRRTGPHQRPRAAPPQALAGRRGAAGRGHQRLHHPQRPASGEPQRHHPRDHRRRRCARPCRTASSTRPTRWRWSTCLPGELLRAAAARARSTCPPRRRGPWRTSSRAPTWEPCARSPSGAPPTAPTCISSTPAWPPASREQTWRRVRHPARVRRSQPDLGRGHPGVEADGRLDQRPLDRRRASRPLAPAA